MNSALRTIPFVIIILISTAIFAVTRFEFGGKKPTVANPLPNAPVVVAPAVEISAADAPGHQKMIDTIASLNKRRSDHEYFGDKKASQLRQNLASITGSNSQMQQFSKMYELGVRELRLGREEEAIALLTSAVKMLPRMSGKINAKAAYDVVFQTGVAYLRLGESQNCCLHNNPDSCVFPIANGGIHSNIEGSSKAIRYFEEALKIASPGGPSSTATLEARWLLNVAHMTLGSYPDKVPAKYLIPADSFESDEDFPKFHNIAQRVGFDTFSLSGGAVADDFNNDDYIDLLVSTWDGQGAMQLFLNNQDGTFTNHENSGLAGIEGGLNMVQADYDNDGDVDILVLRGAWLMDKGSHPNSLLRNNGNGTFVDVTFSAGLGKTHHPTQTASWADYDNDGHLDIFIGNETTPENQSPCQLFHNNGDGTFTDLAQTAGVTNDRFTKAVVWGDFNGDRYPDIYVSNLQGDNRLYRNEADGTFTDVATTLGVAGPRMSFPCWFWDFDNDGQLDIFVSAYSGTVADTAASALGLEFKSQLPHLYQGQTDGSFKEVGKDRNLTTPTLPMGSNYGDIDGDGYLDFYLGTGDTYYKNLMPSVMYRSQSAEKFVNVTTSGGFGNLQKGHGITFADFDNDGDQDVFAEMGGAYLGDRYYDCFYENPGFNNHFLTVKLVGSKTNRSGMGARIAVTISENGESRTVYRHVSSGGSFGASPLRQNIGLGKAASILEVVVSWPTSGETQSFDEVPLDRTIEITENAESFRVIELKTFNYSSASPDAEPK